MAFIASPTPTSFAMDNCRPLHLRSTAAAVPATVNTRSGAPSNDMHRSPNFSGHNVGGHGSFMSARQRLRNSTTTNVASTSAGWPHPAASHHHNNHHHHQHHPFEAALRKWGNAAAERKERDVRSGAAKKARASTTMADDDDEDATSMLLDVRPDYVGEALRLCGEGNIEEAVSVLFDATCIADNAGFVAETFRSLLSVVIGFVSSTGRGGATQYAPSQSDSMGLQQLVNDSSRAESATNSLQSPASLHPVVGAAANPFRRITSAAVMMGAGGVHASPATWQAHAAARQLAARGGRATATTAGGTAGGAVPSVMASPQALAQFMDSPGAGWTSNGNNTAMDTSREELPNASASMASVVSLAIAAPQHTNVAAVGEEMDDGTSELNQYVLLQPVGRGKQGEVFLAMDTEKNELRAIKVVKRPKGAAAGPSAGGPLARARDRQRQQLESEVAIMKRCRHRNVVALYEVIDDPELDCMYLVMQYVEHGPLVKLQRDGTTDRTLSPAALAGYARQLCSGLLYLHKHGVIHRDIKPDNILLGQNDQVYLADFGMAEVFDEAAMAASTTVHGTRGTIAFMAPELLSTTESTAVEGEAVDVWALGITFYVLLFGRLPWEFTDLRSLLHKIETVPVKFPSPPEGGHSVSRYNVRRASLTVSTGAPPPRPPGHGDPTQSAGSVVRAVTAATTIAVEPLTAKPRAAFGTPELLPQSAAGDILSSSDFTPPAISDDDDDDDEFALDRANPPLRHPAQQHHHRHDNTRPHSRSARASRPTARYSVAEICARPYRCGWRPIIAGMLERAPADRTPLATVRRQVASLHAALRDHGVDPLGTGGGGAHSGAGGTAAITSVMSPGRFGPLTTNAPVPQHESITAVRRATSMRLPPTATVHTLQPADY